MGFFSAIRRCRLLGRPEYISSQESSQVGDSLETLTKVAKRHICRLFVVALAWRYRHADGTLFYHLEGKWMTRNIDGDLIRRLRTEASLSQEDLAGLAGISARTLQRLEAESSGSASSLRAVAAALDVNIHNIST